MQTVPIIPAAFVFNCVLVLWFVIGAKGHWFLKVAMLIVTGFFGFGVWQSLDSYLGYPKGTTIAKLRGQEARLLCVWVDEPDNITGDKGAIYLWMLAPTGQPYLLMRGASPDPLAIKLPYDKGTHEAAQDLQAQILAQDNQPLPIKFGEQQKNSSPEGEGPRAGSGGAGGSGGNQTGSMSIGEGRMYALPKPKSPPKVQAQ